MGAFFSAHAAVLSFFLVADVIYTRNHAAILISMVLRAVGRIRVLFVHDVRAIRNEKRRKTSERANKRTGGSVPRLGNVAHFLLSVSFSSFAVQLDEKRLSSPPPLVRSLSLSVASAQVVFSTRELPVCELVRMRVTE